MAESKAAAVPYFPQLQISEIAARHPGSTAVIHERGSLTYGDLERRVNRLARHLQGLGVGPDVLVALRIPRSVELVISLLAVSKAGGAYLLVESAAPPARLRSILDLVRPAFVLAPEEDPLFGKFALPWLAPAMLERDAEVQSDAPPEGNPSPDHLSAVFLTSGSTGTPKAVVVPYGYRIPPSLPPPGTERHVLKTDSGTTFTRGEILTPLRSGQVLCIAPAGVERDSRALSRYLADQEVTHLIVVPSALQSLLDLDDLRWTHSLRSVLCSGEALTPRLKRAFLERTRAELIISYGCTEVPTATIRTLRPGGDPDDPSVGLPAPLMEVHVLDENRRPVPDGDVGEVYLGGLMSRGYFRDPEATARSFVAHPLDATPGARLFRSGDLGRWLPGGGLEVLGRVDRQVKIRGYRIDLGEVETVLSEHPGIAACAVTTREDEGGGAVLVAYVVAREGHRIEATEVAAFVRGRAPRQLVPSKICVLDQLPRTSNGKLDRKALPDPEPVAVAATGRTPPRHPVEIQLVALWESLLNRFPIGIHDNFFDLGGHSLQVVTLLDQIERVFRRRPPLDLLWDGEGTIASLAAFLRGEREVGPHPDLVCLRGGGRRPLFVTDVVSGAGLIHYYKLLPGLDVHQAVYGLLAPGSFGPDPAADSISAIAAHCIPSLRSVQAHGPYRIAGYSSGGLVALELAAQLRRQGETVERLVLLDTRLPRGLGLGRILAGIRARIAGPHSGLRELLQCHALALRRAAGVRTFSTQAEAHLWAQYHFRPDPYPGAVDLMKAMNGDESEESPLNGWGSVLAGQVTVHEIPADHLGMMRPPQVVDVGRRLQQLLDSEVR